MNVKEGVNDQRRSDCASKEVRLEGGLPVKTFQSLRVSSPAPVTIFCASGERLMNNTLL